MTDKLDYMEEDAKQASIPYTYNAPQHDWKCGYPDITRDGFYQRRTRTPKKANSV